MLQFIKRMFRAFDPAQSSFSLTTAGRRGPLPKKPAHVRTSWPARRTGVVGLIALTIAYALADYVFDLDTWLERLIDWLWAVGVPQLVWSGVELIFFLGLGILAVRLAGRVFWGIQRLHDLGRSARHIAPDLAWMLAAIVPVVAIAHGLDTMMQLPTERSNLLASYLAALALWLLPFYMAFWSQHLKTWNEAVETVAGDPGKNRYGAAPT